MFTERIVNKEIKRYFPTFCMKPGQYEGFEIQQQKLLLLIKKIRCSILDNICRCWISFKSFECSEILELAKRTSVVHGEVQFNVLICIDTNA